METTNKEKALAWEYICRTSSNIFLTGRAGTGKTTFLHHVVSECAKRKIVVAPTGIAAINAKGTTIHSFFQLQFGVSLPEIKHTQYAEQNARYRFSKTKRDIIRSLDLLIIDEVSMLRCDTMDEVDAVLKRIRKNNLPFGGVQVLMIGDMQQLPPVVKAEEWEMLKNHYASPYFFDSKVLKDNPYVCVELKHIYRQKDANFIQLLEAVRKNQMTLPLLEQLNKRFIPNFEAPKDDTRITLCTHNFTAKKINNHKIEQINAPSFIFKARVVNNFPEHMFPQEELLVLKEGAQVMFTKNDPTPAKRFVNGTIGTVSELASGHIEVCTQEGTTIEVDVAFWENIRYNIDKETKEITSDIDGLFYQYPLKLAWAITIHKSQGLTFDKVLIDAAHSFTHGQVYVALSRCRTLEGIVLKSPISASSIINDKTVSLFNHDTEKRTPTDDQLRADAQSYFLRQAQLLFDCSEWTMLFRRMNQFMQSSLRNLYPLISAEWNKCELIFIKEINEVSIRFRQSLQNLVREDYKTNTFLQERIRKAATYFAEKADECLLTLVVQTVNLDIDAKQTKTDFKALFTDFMSCYALKSKLWQQGKEGFELNTFLLNKAQLRINIDSMRMEQKVLSLLPDKEREKHEESVNEKAGIKKAKAEKKDEETDITNPILFEKLKAWRKEKAAELKVPSYVVAHQKVLIGITNSSPQSKAALLKIKGIGTHFIEHYADDVLKIIHQETRDM